MSEAVALGKMIEEHEREEARKRQEAGINQYTEASGNFPEASPEETGQTRDKVGEAIGMSGKTYEKARAVVEAASEAPEVFADCGAHSGQLRYTPPRPVRPGSITCVWPDSPNPMSDNALPSP